MQETSTLESLLSHPAVQGGLAPFVVALIVVLILHRFRLGPLPLIARSFRFDGEVIWGLTYQILRELLQARARALRVGGRG